MFHKANLFLKWRVVEIMKSNLTNLLVRFLAFSFQPTYQTHDGAIDKENISQGNQWGVG